MYKRKLNVEIADTPTKQQQGLMFRTKLEEDEGMLFKFNKPQKLNFWGLNTYIPLAIAFVSPENVIEKISYISPCSEKIVSSDTDCNMAIEANYKFFEENKISAGMKISVSKEKDKTIICF